MYQCFTSEGTFRHPPTQLQTKPKNKDLTLSSIHSRLNYLFIHYLVIKIPSTIAGNTIFIPTNLQLQFSCNTKVRDLTKTVMLSKTRKPQEKQNIPWVPQGHDHQIW